MKRTFFENIVTGTYIHLDTEYLVKVTPEGMDFEGEFFDSSLALFLSDYNPDCAEDTDKLIEKAKKLAFLSHLKELVDKGEAYEEREKDIKTLENMGYNVDFERVRNSDFVYLIFYEQLYNEFRNCDFRPPLGDTSAFISDFPQKVRNAAILTNTPNLKVLSEEMEVPYVTLYRLLNEAKPGYDGTPKLKEKLKRFCEIKLINAHMIPYNIEIIIDQMKT